MKFKSRLNLIDILYCPLILSCGSVDFLSLLPVFITYDMQRYIVIKNCIKTGWGQRNYNNESKVCVTVTFWSHIITTLWHTAFLILIRLFSKAGCYYYYQLNEQYLQSYEVHLFSQNSALYIFNEDTILTAPFFNF